MKTIDSAVLAARAEALRTHMLERESICGRLQPKIEHCDPAGPSLLVSFPVLPWELNVNGVLNGGISATMLDAAMGTLSYAISGGFTPTISLNVSYLRPVPGEGTVMVRATATMAGRSVICLNGELYDARDPDRLLATAQGVFRNLEGGA